jgi:hypothetical protein
MATEAFAETRRYTIGFGDNWLGIRDMTYWDGKTMTGWTEVGMAGLRRNFKVPFTATPGLIGFCVILATLIIVPTVLTVRWTKRGTTP